MFSMNPADRRCAWANGGLFFLWLLAWPWMFPPESHAQQRNRRRDAGPRQGPSGKIGQQLQAMEREVAALRARAQAAQSRLDAATLKLDSAQQAAVAAEPASDELAERVREIAKDIEASQSADSSFARATREFQRAREVLDARRARILNSAGYLSKLEKAKLATNRAEALARVRQETLDGDAVYRVAFREQQRARIALGQVRQRILQASQPWLDAAEAERRASRTAAEAKAAVETAARSRGSAGSDLREAAKRAAAAQQAVARIRGEVQQLTTGKNRRPQQTGSNSKNKKR